MSKETKHQSRQAWSPRDVLGRMYVLQNKPRAQQPGTVLGLQISQEMIEASLTWWPGPLPVSLHGVTKH